MVKALAVGISHAELNIDSPQAGGLLGKFDVMIIRAISGRPASSSVAVRHCSARSERTGSGGVEIKGSRNYRGGLTFQFSRL